MDCIIKTLIAIILTFQIQGCGILVAIDGWGNHDKLRLDDNTVLVIPPAVTKKDALFQEYVDKFALMALFSKVAYRQDIPEATRTGHGCDYLKGTPEKFGMPRHQDSGWERMSLVVQGADGDDDVVSCYDKHGLYYETYIYRPGHAKEPSMAVIAIRGTENYNWYQKMRDWPANLAALFGIDPSQYSHARVTILPLLKKLRLDHPDMEIYLTGHSLGGGIAQQIAYASDKKLVKETYVFDTSPITNWTGMMTMQPRPILNQEPVVYRVNHSREFLDWPRTVFTRLTATQLNRSDYEFRFQAGSRIDSHEMGILACNLVVRISDQAYFGLPKSFVPVILKDEGICPAQVIKRNAVFERAFGKDGKFYMEETNEKSNP